MCDNLRNLLIVLLLMIMGNITILADDFDPTTPPEPQTLFKITTSAAPDVNGILTSGTGQYPIGKTVYINTSATQGFVFKYWLKDGKLYSTKRNFHYTVTNENPNFVAVWEYDPMIPDEPLSINEYRLYMLDSPEGSCSFNNNSGEKVEAGNYINLTAYPNQGFQFLGWYCNGVKINHNLSFGFLMPSENTTLTARFVFDPVLPGEPESNGDQTEVSNGSTGDINSDGDINITDVVILVNRCVNGIGSNVRVSDINGDGLVNISDVVSLVNKSLKGNK